jgi:hypothetical protein
MPKIDPTVTHDKQRKVLKLMIRLYGDDSEELLNALHEMAARVGIMAGVEPEIFAAGMKHHWDYLAFQLNTIAKNTGHA